MIRKRRVRHRLRKQIIKILTISFLIVFTIKMAGTFIIYLLTSDVVEAANFAEYASKNISEEITDIQDAKNWSGWSKQNPVWKVTIVDENSSIVYQNNDYFSSINFWIPIKMDIENLNGEIILSYVPGENTQIYSDILSIVDWLLFFIIFTLMFKRIENYTYEIADGISILAGGEMRHRIPIKSSNELTMIASNINEMASALSSQMEAKNRSDRERDALITNLAHDIRTPITILEGYLSMMINDNDISEHKRKEYLEISLNKCNELSSRADNIFEYVRLNNKREQLSYSEVKAKSYVLNQLEEMSMILSREGFGVEADIKIDQNDRIKVDTQITQRVFDNILSNIIKYADSSKNVLFKAYSEEHSVVICFKNKSKDIISMEPERLFERTVSGDLSRNGKSEGLGLAICKLIMEMQNGKIKAEIIDGDIEFSIYFLKI
ncbi:MAG: HAMP domain-containing sensor histidine kinase [Eubacteriales bacterium]